MFAVPSGKIFLFAFSFRSFNVLVCWAILHFCPPFNMLVKFMIDPSSLCFQPTTNSLICTFDMLKILLSTPR